MGFYNTSSCTEAERTYVRLALQQVRNWRGRFDYEEMASEAVLGAFAAVAESTGDAAWLNRVALRGAKSALLNYIRYHSRLKRAGKVISLDAQHWDVIAMEHWESTREPSVPDFVPDLVARVDWFTAMRQCCTAEQQRYLYRFYYLGQTYKEIAQAEAVTRKRVDNKMYEGLLRLRAALGPQETG